ncbi:DUF2274 domain-containing protein [Paraburkholderia sp. CNPSo 3157]|uniref:DUF2274 domain-containing protein n=1 Tax=Paraburkholderia franconis TaxID=2654983 RepID=A0A7X1NL06_9BURK|nr:DUF2274 domain-containing protein [Paraburkholderia franconis]MPW23914.1 DUF2274 domain-containing protein [Paraburkholderia franconis]
MTQKLTRKSSARLLLPVVKREPEKTRLPVNLSQEVHADLLAYQRAYQDMNDAEVSLDFIIEHVIVQHLKRDKAFQAWKATTPKAADQSRSTA